MLRARAACARKCSIGALFGWLTNDKVKVIWHMRIQYTVYTMYGRIVAIGSKRIRQKNKNRMALNSLNMFLGHNYWFFSCAGRLCACMVELTY